MARHKVNGKEMAKHLKISDNAISALKNADVMPRIDGKRLDEIAAAINACSKVGGGVNGVDLLEVKGL